jgi:hypothetical protein
MWLGNETNITQKSENEEKHYNYNVCMYSRLVRTQIFHIYIGQLGFTVENR